MESPARTCWLALRGAVRSTSFLSAFVGIFQVSLMQLVTLISMQSMTMFSPNDNELMTGGNMLA